MGDRLKGPERRQLRDVPWPKGVAVLGLFRGRVLAILGWRRVEGGHAKYF